MDRIKELLSYDILDTGPELEMDEIAQIASSIFDTPYSVVSFIDGHRQWYKSKIGVEWNEVPLENTFCRFTLDTPEEVLLIQDPLNDFRVFDNPYVRKEDGIRFYVSAPILSSSGNVLGTVCTWDTQKHEVQHAQIEVLKILAKRVALSLETRKLVKVQQYKIELFSEKLKNLTDLSPGALFKLIIDPVEKIYLLDFISVGISRLIPELSPETLIQNPVLFTKWISPQFRFRFLRRIIESGNQVRSFEMDLPILINEEKITWLWIKARPLSLGNKIHFYGTVQEISQKIAHIKSLKKILFDISHLLRAPVAKIKGILNIIQEEDSVETTKEMTPYIFKSVEDLDLILNNLNLEYSELVQLLSEKK